MTRSFVSAVVLSAFMIVSCFSASAQSIIEVTGSATINVVPDRITVEIGMEEYFIPNENNPGDSVLVGIKAVERAVMKTLLGAGVPDSMINVSDMGNYRDRRSTSEFLMAKRLSAVVTNIGQLDNIARRVDRKGITSFNISKIDNSDMGRYNRQGLKSALDAAREKAEFIAANEGLVIVKPVEIVENSSGYNEGSMFSNVAYGGGSGMDGMRRIVRRYSVTVKYQFSDKKSR